MSSRIWLDLSALLSGIHKNSVVLLDHEKLKTVRDLEIHIRRVFDIKRPFCILNEGFLLPSSESSTLLRDNETVSVVPLEDAQPSGECDTAKTDTASKAASRSVHITEPVNSPFTPTETNNCPRKENGINHSEESSAKALLNPFSSPEVRAASHKRTLSVEKSSSDNEASNDQSSIAQDEDEKNNEIEGPKKRKRLRRRPKKKSLEETPVEEPKPRQSRYVMNKFYQGVSHILNTTVASSTNKKHIFFKEEPEENSHEIDTALPSPTPGNKEAPNAPVHNTLSGERDGLDKLLSLRAQKSPIVFERKKVDAAQGVKVRAQKSPIVFERKKVDAAQGVTVNLPCKDKPKGEPPVPKYVPLQVLPVKETIIRFKILKMVNYCPTVSDFITARVISPDRESQQIYVQIKEGLDEFADQRGKFSLEQDEEGESLAPPNPYRFLNWSDLMETMAIEFN